MSSGQFAGRGPRSPACARSAATARPPALTSTGSTPVTPCRIGFVAQLEPALADVVRAAVIRRFAAFLDPFLVAHVDAGRCSRRCATPVALWIVAEQPARTSTPGSDSAARRTGRPPRPERLRIGTLSKFRLSSRSLRKRRRFTRIDRDDFAEIPRRIESRDGDGVDLERVRGEVACEHDARCGRGSRRGRHDRQQGDAIVLGPGMEIVVLHDLQEVETRREQTEADDDEEPGDKDAAAEAREFLFCVRNSVMPQIGRLSSRSTGWNCGNSNTKCSGNHNATPVKLDGNTTSRETPRRRRGARAP